MVRRLVVNLMKNSYIMNARSQVFELTMEGRMVDEAVASIFHTVLFHRSLGKFMYADDSSYSVGTVGHMDVDCDFIDFTYVCCTSQKLDRTLKKEISRFSEQLRSNDSCGSGQISLEFFQRKRRSWPFQMECIPWEVWTVRLELNNLCNEDERQVCRERVSDMLSDKIFYITEVMNRHDYVPKMPSQSELDTIFDTSYADIQPYLFTCRFSTAEPNENSVGHTMKKLIKETLSL
ncbi:Autophagy-related protein 101 [Pseudolycoriella hygida]|uniref:Autophagy-related protein 101 n=1 Tax=Pseudolycoriella hygida TaxID=35572 RepID=A0A9Q0MW10_9DIPT|nr:Autophagy-related protein 101 [Pseudolycoriella hygida]